MDGFMRSGNFKTEADARMIVEEGNFADPENIEFEEYKKILIEAEKNPTPARTAFRRGTAVNTAFAPVTSGWARFGNKFRKPPPADAANG